MLVLLDRLLIVIHTFLLLYNIHRYRGIETEGRTNWISNATCIQISILSCMAEVPPSGISVCQYLNAVLYPFPLMRIYARQRTFWFDKDGTVYWERTYMWFDQTFCWNKQISHCCNPFFLISIETVFKRLSKVRLLGAAVMVQIIRMLSSLSCCMVSLLKKIMMQWPVGIKAKPDIRTIKHLRIMVTGYRHTVSTSLLRWLYCLDSYILSYDQQSISPQWYKMLIRMDDEQFVASLL